MAIRELISSGSFSREQACALILVFMNKKLVAYLDKVKAHTQLVQQNAAIPPGDVPKKSQSMVTIREITEDITSKLIPGSLMLGEKEFENIRREIADYVNILVKNPGSHRFLDKNKVIKVRGKNSGEAIHYHLQSPLSELTPQDLAVIYEDFQFCFHLLSHVVGVNDMIDGKQNSIAKLEKMLGGNLGDLGNYSEKNPILILKTGGFPAKLRASDCQNLMALIKKAFQEGLQIEFDYKKRDDELEKHHEIDPVGIDLNIANGTLWLIAAGKKPDAKGKLNTKPNTYIYRLEKIKNARLGTKKLLLTENDRSEIRDFISNDLEGNYIRSKAEILTAKVMVDKTFNEYVTYTPWFSKQKFLKKQGEHFVYQVEAVKETIFQKVHSARGVAIIIHPPGLVKEFLAECDFIKKKHESVIAEIRPPSPKRHAKKKSPNAKTQ